MSLIKFDVKTATVPEPEPPKPEPPEMNLYRVKPDHLTWTWNYQIRDVVRNGFLASAPAVFRTGEITDPKNFIRSTFSEKWQWFSIDLLSMSVHGVLFSELTGDDKKIMIRKWGVFTDKGRFLNNFAGTDNKNNYITGEMRDGEPKIDPLICTNSIVKVLDVRKSSSGRTKGLDMAKLYAFDESETPPRVTKELLDNDPRILTATVIYPNGNVIDFPQYPSQRHPYPLISARNSERWFPLTDLEKVTR